LVLYQMDFYRKAEGRIRKGFIMYPEDQKIKRNLELALQSGMKLNTMQLQEDVIADPRPAVTETSLGFDDVSVRDVYIVGTPFCGSTLLGNALNGHPDISYMGETDRLFPFRINPLPTKCNFCTANDEKCPIWSEDLIDKMTLNGPASVSGLYREIVKAPIVVDGSKHAYWLQKVHAEGGISDDTVAIVSVRNPLAFANSWRNYTKEPIWQGANLWRDTYFDIFRTLACFNMPYLIVRYEEFAFRPKKILKIFCGFMGISFDSKMMQFWEEPLHSLGGNWGAHVWFKNSHNLIKFQQDQRHLLSARNAFKEHTFGGWVDKKWHGRIRPNEISAALTTPYLIELAAFLGYDIKDLIL